MAKKNSTLPTSIKIGIYNYEVIETNDIGMLLLDGQQCVGTIRYDELQIHVDKNRTPARKEQTLMHEIVHGIIIEHDVPIEDRDNYEEIVDKFSIGILQVLKDNPELFRR